MKEEIKIGKEIWPDVDSAEEINQFLKKFGVELEFLLSDGIKFEYPAEKLEPFVVSSSSLYFKDVMTRDPVLHFYEDFGELVFEGMGERKVIPILEEVL